MPKDSNRFFLIGIILVFALGLFLRVYRLGETPPGFYIDEASFGYNAYSILKTGADEFGTRFPLFTPSFGTGKNPVYLYSTVASVAVFGLNEFSVRLPAAVFGALTILFTYLLGASLTGRKSIGLLAALFVALNPWSLFMSRFAVEVTSLSCFVTAGFFLLHKSLKNPRLMPVAALVLALSLYTYAPAIPFIFLMAPVFVFLFRREVFGAGAGVAIISALIFIVVAVPGFMPQFKGEEQFGHFRKSLVFNEVNDAKSRELLRESPWPGPVFADASPSVMRGAVVARNYLSNYSPGYLFVRGDMATLRARVDGYGAFLRFFIPFLFIGLLLLISKRGPEWRFLLAWLVLYPLGSAIAEQTWPSATRTITAIPVYQLIFAAALIAVAEKAAALVQKDGNAENIKVAKIAAVTVMLTVYCIFAGGFLKHYFVEYPKYSVMEWNAGFRESIEKAETIDSHYAQVVVTNNIPYSYIYVLFYTKYDPAELHEKPLVKKGEYLTGDMGRYAVRDPYKQFNTLPQLFITGFWERPDLDEIDFGMRPGEDSIVKMGEYIPNMKSNAGQHPGEGMNE